jgi:MFS family permease
MHRLAKHRHLLIIAASIAGSSMVMLGESVASLALPSIGRTLQVPFASLQWVVDGYNLTLSAFILLGGSLGDLFGLRRVYLWSAAVFLLLSILCALAWSGLTLILFRSLLGVAGALLTPVSLAVLNAQLPKDMRSRAVGYWTAATSIVLALGPLVGGLSRRPVFVARHFPLQCTGRCPYDHAGLCLPGEISHRTRHSHRLGGCGPCLPVSRRHHLWPHRGPGQWLAGVYHRSPCRGAMSLVAFVWWESRVSYPLVDLVLFRNRNFSATNAATLLLYAAFGGFGFLFSYFLQTTAGYSTTATGAAFIPVSVMLALLSGTAGEYSSRFGPRWFMSLGPIFCAAGMLTLLPLGPQTTYLSGVLPGVLLFGVGLVLTVAPLTATALNSAPDEKSGIASAINNGAASAGPLIVIALLGLAGIEHAYVFGVWLCVILAALAGLVSFSFVRKAAA